MANTLGYYNPYFYAQEALKYLHNAMGMASRVYMGYDAERRSFGKGEYVNISRPSAMTVGNAPWTTGQDLVPDSVQVQLAYWREVRFWLTDKELAFTTEKMIEDHIGPAAIALANDIDVKLAALYKDIGALETVATSTAIATTDITAMWRRCFNQQMPMNDLANIHCMVDGTTAQQLLDLTPFASFSGGAAAGAGPMGAETLRTGELGQRYGFNWFSNQNVQTHTAGAAADKAGAIAAGSDKTVGTVELVIDDLTDTQTVKAGDSLTIAGQVTEYAITDDATVASNTITVGISPPLKVAVAEDDVVTISEQATGPANLAFHKNAFALVTAPLSTIGDELGAKIATVTDPVTGVSLRSRLWYDGSGSRVQVSIDVLYGVKTLDGSLGCKLINIP